MKSAVDLARESWIRRLIDLSRRNNLLYYRDLKTGTLDLTDHDAEAMASLWAGEAVTLNTLLPRADTTRTTAQTHEIRRRAQSNLEEKGLDTLYVALGIATWTPADGGRAAAAPVLLVPVAIEPQGREGRVIKLRRTGDVQVNLALLHFLDTELGCHVAPETLLAATPDDENADFVSTAFARLQDGAKQVHGFAIAPRAVLGNFSFQKLAMVKDLRERGEELAKHDLIAALAGDATARVTAAGGRADIDPRTFDQVAPDQEFFVLDADASQQRVVASVLAGQHGVIQGPPGTGKSQTIANLITTLAANGQRVLFVAEKRAALEVVKHRLEAVGLGHLGLDLHGADVSRREVMRQMAESLKIIGESLPVDAAEPHRRLAERRRQLNAHVARLHVPRAPAGVSAYELQGRLLRLSEQCRMTTRWRGAELDGLTGANAEAIQDLLIEAAGFDGLFLRQHPSPWTGASLPDGAAVEQAMTLAARLVHELFPTFKAEQLRATSATELAAPASLEEMSRLVSLLTGVNETLSSYAPGIFDEDLEQMSTALAPAGRGSLQSAWAWLVDAQFRDARTRTRQHRRKVVRAAQLFAEVRAAAYHRRRWRALSTSAPRKYDGVDQLRGALDAVVEAVSTLWRYLGRDDLLTMPLDDLSRLLTALADDSETPHRLPRLGEIEHSLAERGAAALIAELRRLKPRAELWPKCFEHAWLASCLDRARTEDTTLAGFNGRTHERYVGEFCRLDERRIGLAAARVRRAHAERTVAAMNTYPEQTALVRREAAKATRHLPLRRLVAEAPNVLTALRPCWMASPLSVSQLIPADRRYFDVVVFDEASQVLPEDGVPALLRATYAVVAGDRHQLPPTTFFAAGEDDEDLAEGELPLPTEGFDSLLDLMSSFLDPWPLEWHYRSRDETLIAFANREVYRDTLVTFPGPGGPAAVQHLLVDAEGGRDGHEISPAREVERVVALVLEHAEKRPGETLGVIALGITHARRVEAAIDAARQERPDLDEYFAEGRLERFFVKNLERVQGDERDAIILTLGAGRDRAGHLDHRQFGPLNQDGGERRLNVAITRARRRMTVASSFTHADVDAKRAPSRGVQMLRQYLEYAATGGARMGDGGAAPTPLNHFELDVYDALTAKGLSLIPQWGASRYRIDLVVQHPTKPGRFVMAIECDGASYHAAPTARDRDRLRQQHLEALGWRFHRIWSTDWFMRREEEISRALTAFGAAVAHADQLDATGAATIASGADSPSTVATTTTQPARTAARRSPRPSVPRRSRIEDYGQRELVDLVRWIQSDGRLRTDEEIVGEMVEELGFSRRGRNIEAEIRRTIEALRLRA